MLFPLLQAEADTETEPEGALPRPGGGALARCIVGSVVRPEPVRTYKFQACSSPPLPRPSPLPRLPLGLPGLGREVPTGQLFPSRAQEAEAGGTRGGATRVGVNARSTCSLRASPEKKKKDLDSYFSKEDVRMANKMKRCFTLLLIRKMQMKTTVKLLKGTEFL